MPRTWKLAKGTGRVSSAMSTSQRNEGGAGTSFATSSSATRRRRRPRSGKGTGNAVCVSDRRKTRLSRRGTVGAETCPRRRTKTSSPAVVRLAVRANWPPLMPGVPPACY
jgi:hypothetical protein